MSTPVIFTRPPRRTKRRPEPEPTQRQPRWVMTVILLSLLAHLLFVLGLVLANKLVPPPKLKEPPPPESTTLSLEPPPPAQAAPPPQHPFMPTEADPGAVHKETLIESANDTRLKSESNTARNPDSVMPDVTSKVPHASDLKNSPNTPAKEPPHPAQQATKPASQQQQTQPSPQQAQESPPKPQQAQKPEPPQPNTTPPPKLPPTKEQAQKPAEQPQQYDPNGLPVLPALNVPTLAPASQQRQEQAVPVSSLPAVAQDSHGALGTHGANSPEAMATELGKYKQRVYAAIGSYWYPAVDAQFSILPVGVVHIQFTIEKDGTVEDVKILEGDTGNLQVLRTISQDAIMKSAPYPPFTPGMIQQVGDSYTDDVSFSIYGQ